MRPITFVRTGIVVAMLGSTVANAMGCLGTACKEVVFSFNNGCYEVTNLSNKRVSVTIGAVSFTVESGKTRTVAGLDNRCVASFESIPKANYEQI
jgi:hypothetical protein